MYAMLVLGSVTLFEGSQLLAVLMTCFFPEALVVFLGPRWPKS